MSFNSSDNNYIGNIFGREVDGNQPVYLWKLFKEAADIDKALKFINNYSLDIMYEYTPYYNTFIKKINKNKIQVIGFYKFFAFYRQATTMHR